ncbi:MAG: PilC/PilY family type IV pilus protein [Candidatus Thiodiazotropha endolucinida]|nr:VWA domain-containing protein [Candidatus Thiodiazotropha taylori]MCW4289483.1 PilC/PilY family type IV pilus protein [Candidatus Thiodiazotropha endolucinida]
MSHKGSKSGQGLHPLTKACLLSLILFSLVSVRADDIEVYLQPPPEPVAPNILFLLDESSSMDNPVAPGVTRRDALVNALYRIVDGGLLNNVNATLLGYTTIREDPTATRLVSYTGDFTIVGNDISHFRSAIDQLQSLNFTPTTDALAAAVDWFNPNRRPDRIQNSSSESPLTGDPEELKCAPNRIVLLSDGAPNTSTRTGYEGIACAEFHLFDDFSDERPGWHNDGARCANEISAWAYQTDLATGTGWDGVQNILTYTLSFGTTPGSPTQRFMDQIAASGGGESWYVVDEDSIVDAFNTVIAEAQDSIDYAMNAPSIPFNPDNAAINGDYIYVPLFLPEARRFWRGNLKKYRVDVSDDDIRLLASGGQRVLNDDHTFASTIDLFCTQGGCLPDGGDPLSGGVADNMTGLRTLYTNLDPGLSLAHPSNRIHRETAGITMEMLGVANEEDRTTLLNWITRDPAYIATAQHPAHDGVMGAPIHTQPAVVRYGQESTVYLPTSEGVLEAIDANTGRELWAFMPKDLMTNIRRIRNNTSSVTPHYGLDGPLSIYETGGRKIAIVGMRRGGRKYHMLDITDRLEPDYLAEISREASPTDYARLGQTWSKPLFVRMHINGSERDVLIFGGGYDPDQDNDNRPDDEGNAIYIVDAANGSLLASIAGDEATHTVAGMDYAIPGNLATVDINGNGLVDRIYATDVGGRIIRMDFADDEDSGNSITGGIVADINRQSSAHRKFFTTPQIGYYAKGTRQFLVLLIGTGDHANPLDSDIRDRFYLIKDGDIWENRITQAPAGEYDFIDATSTILNNGEVLDDQVRGWYITLPAGEKSYSRAILYDYAIFFSTYRADRVAPETPCEASSITGTASIYGLDLISANAAINWDGATEAPLTLSDRSTQLALQGIPPSPMLIFPGGEDGDGNPILGKKIFLFADLEKKHEWGDSFRPIYWEEVIED